MNHLAVSDSRFSVERRIFHDRLVGDGIFSYKDGIPSNSDKDSAMSVALASSLLLHLSEGRAPIERKRMAPQTLGKKFEEAVAAFIERTFIQSLSHLRPGTWSVTRSATISEFQQYSHLTDLARAADESPELAAILGNDYTVKPDVVVLRHREPDARINEREILVDDYVSVRSDLRYRPGRSPLMHASVSCKWTMRSDRAQNARTESLNLIRNRKGHLPHMVVITAEPLPSRLAAIALGTGDVDCAYHFALDELRAAVRAGGYDDADEMLNTMINGERLKDIADLPLDLAT